MREKGGLEARAWLEDSSAKGNKFAEMDEKDLKSLWQGDTPLFHALVLPGIHLSLAERGHVLCSLRIPSHLTDDEGNWHTGAIAAAMDNVCAATIVSADGITKVSMHYDISYYSPAKFNEEVVMEGRVVERKGMLTAVVVKVKKKANGELVAVGRQWMSASRGKKIHHSSKL